jgi:HD-GYP domain-containing protein (c-di-GMP phosphodiesterase class II)
VSAAPALTNTAELIRSSHERIDGQGYPDGLAGQDIPLGSRIIFVCDAFEAMTSDRLYRRGIDIDAALEELKRHAGTQFDATVVKAFCNNMMLQHSCSGEQQLSTVTAKATHHPRRTPPSRSREPSRNAVSRATVADSQPGQLVAVSGMSRSMKPLSDPPG